MIKKCLIKEVLPLVGFAEHKYIICDASNIFCQPFLMYMNEIPKDKSFFIFMINITILHS